MAAGRTYTPLARTTISTATASVTFSSISSSYTDLILIINCGDSLPAETHNFRFNSDTGTNYSLTTLYGNGSTTATARESNRTNGCFAYFVVADSPVEYMSILHIMNYSNTTTFKAALSRSNRASANNYPGAEAIVNLWRNTSAITSITLFPNAGNFVSGSTISLYGIAAA